jgi:hypothetical protein
MKKRMTKKMNNNWSRKKHCGWERQGDGITKKAALTLHIMFSDESAVYRDTI